MKPAAKHCRTWRLVGGACSPTAHRAVAVGRPWACWRRSCWSAARAGGSSSLERYRRNTLVAHVDNAQTIDLSKLATSSASNELIDCGDLLTVTIDSGYEGDRERCRR